MEKLKLSPKLTQFIQKYKYVLLVLLAGVLLMLWPASSEKEKEAAVINGEPASILSMEDKLESILSSIHGAGKVRVMLSTKTGEETVYQTDDSFTDEGSVDSVDTVTVTDGDRTQDGLVRFVIGPTYQGAIVVCEGADSASVRLAVVDAVSKVTGLSSDRISVLKMN